MRPAGSVQKDGQIITSSIAPHVSQQGTVRGRRVAGQTFGVEVRREGVSFLHAGEAGGGGQGAETGTGSPAEILRKSVMTAALLASVLKKAP